LICPVTKPTKVYQDMLPKRVSIIGHNRLNAGSRAGTGQDRARLIEINSPAVRAEYFAVREE
jgi:hypothetical protein